MSDPRTLRILEIDGGGERGYMSLQFLKKFVQQWGIDPADIWKNFDVICGTSVGGIMALALASGQTLDQMTPFFTVQGPYIFSLTSLTPSVRPGLASKLALIVADIPFYQSSGPTMNSYGHGLLYQTVQDNFGTDTLQNLKTNVIIPAYEQDTSTYVLFSNLNYSEFIGQNELVSNVALATGAAPIYLPALSMNGHDYIDGGVYQNNPAQFGLNLAKMIKPRANRYCVLSIGTGIGEMGFDPNAPGVVDTRVAPVSTLAFDSIATIFGLFDIAATGGQESVAKNLALQSKYTLDQLYYYRFQPDLDLALNTELDNTDPSILAYYDNTATEYFNNDIMAISNFIGHLTA
jgi:hypothetical protein